MRPERTPLEELTVLPQIPKLIGALRGGRGKRKGGEKEGRGKGGERERVAPPQSGRRGSDYVSVETTVA